MRTRSSALAPMRCIALASLLIFLLVAGTAYAMDAGSEKQVCTAANADSAECTGDLPPMKGVAADEGNDDGCTDDHIKCAEWADLGECVANPKYMLVSCRKACGICGDTQDTADDEVCEDADPKNCPLWATDTILQYRERSVRYHQRSRPVTHNLPQKLWMLRYQDIRFL